MEELTRSDQTFLINDLTKRGGFEYSNVNGVENTPAGCSVLYSESAVEDGTTTNYNTALQICNILDNTRPIALGAIDKSKFLNRIENTPNDNYVFLSVKQTPAGKCYRYVYLNNDMTADTTREVRFEGACGNDTNLDHNAILNSE